MALYNKEVFASNVLGIWEINEDIDDLLQHIAAHTNHTCTKKYRDSINGFGSPKRKIEWLATRALTSELLRQPFDIAYNEWGKPYLQNCDTSISISHSYNRIAVLLGKSESIGIDIEYMDGRIVKVARKFVADSELAAINPAHYITSLYIYWCTKEALFKLYGRGNLDFKNNLHVKPFDVSTNGNVSAVIAKDGIETSYNFRYFVDNSYLVVYSAD